MDTEPRRLKKNSVNYLLVILWEILSEFPFLILNAEFRFNIDIWNLKTKWRIKYHVEYRNYNAHNIKEINSISHQNFCNFFLYFVVIS